MDKSAHAHLRRAFILALIFVGLYLPFFYANVLYPSAGPADTNPVHTEAVRTPGLLATAFAPIVGVWFLLELMQAAAIKAKKNAGHIPAATLHTWFILMWATYIALSAALLVVLLGGFPPFTAFTSTLRDIYFGLSPVMRSIVGAFVLVSWIKLSTHIFRRRYAVY